MMLIPFAAFAAPADLTSPVHIESGAASGICVSMFPSRPIRKKDHPIWEQVRAHVTAGEMREAVKLSKTAKTHPAQRTVAAAAYVAEQGLAIDIEPTVVRYPNDPCLRQLAANVALRADDKAGARRHLDAAIRSAPDDPQLARLRALLAEDPAERLAGITVAADMHPQDVSLQRLATSVAKENGQLDIALTYAMRAKELGDEDGNLVALARQTGNLDAYLRLLVDEGLPVVGPGLQEPGDLEARVLEWLELDNLEDRLTAVFHTTMGDLRCDLLVAHAPVTVMNFVGLARGDQPWTTPDGKVVQRPIYNDTIFHRVIPEFMVQGGDPEGTGSGGPGYRFLDETDGPYAFDKPGVLAMANSGPATNGSQFFVTERPTTHLSGKHTIFGQCDEDSVRLVKSMARVPVQGTTPVDDIILESITFER